MPNTAPKTKTIVKRLQSMGGRWDDEAETWTVPTDQKAQLRLLLTDIGADVEWVDAEAA